MEVMSGMADELLGMSIVEEPSDDAREGDTVGEEEEEMVFDGSDI